MFSGKTNFFFELTFSGMDKRMHSPPRISVAEVAIASSTVMRFFFNAFFNADFVKAAIKMPTPYSCSRTGVGKWETICVSVEMILFYFLFIG